MIIAFWVSVIIIGLIGLLIIIYGISKEESGYTLSGIFALLVFIFGIVFNPTKRDSDLQETLNDNPALQENLNDNPALQENLNDNPALQENLNDISNNENSINSIEYPMYVLYPHIPDFGNLFGYKIIDVSYNDYGICYMYEINNCDYEGVLNLIIVYEKILEESDFEFRNNDGNVKLYNSKTDFIGYAIFNNNDINYVIIAMGSLEN